MNKLLKKKPAVATEANGAILSLRGVTRTYPTAQGGLTVLKGVDLEVMPGEVVGLIGPSGSESPACCTRRACWSGRPAARC